MIASIHYKNFKVLRDATLPLGNFTLIVGPNGSGKSTALKALQAAAGKFHIEYARTVSRPNKESPPVEVRFDWGAECLGASTVFMWAQGRGMDLAHRGHPSGRAGLAVAEFQRNLRVYALDANQIGGPAPLRPSAELSEQGYGLAVVLDRLRDDAPERFEALNGEVGRWFPEFDEILFDTPVDGHRAIALRTRQGQDKILATELSQGTLLALTILTVAYLPQPPSFVGFEEPDRGIHPRLLRDVCDALFRLAYPENFGESRPAVQVVATTHSPYLVDLFSDHPEMIVIAEKFGQEASFQRLSDLPNIDEILRGAHLGDVWYSGILGGVPAGT